MTDTNDMMSCGCREYPEYGDACGLVRGHAGPHDWAHKDMMSCGHSHDILSLTVDNVKQVSK